MSLVLEALPSIAAEVAAPLAKTDEIVLIGGGNNTTNEINKLVGTLPPAVQVYVQNHGHFVSKIKVTFFFAKPSIKY